MSLNRSCAELSLNDNQNERMDIKGAQFVIQSNLKILSKAVQTLAKLAEDVYLEVSDAGLLFKSINRSKSMYSVFRFAPDFFNDCDMSLINEKNTNVCRITTKSALFIFKGATTFGDKNFHSCEFRIDPLAKTMGVKLQLNYDISRIIEVNLLETSGTLLRPLHDKTKFRNKTVVFASVVLPLLSQMKNEHEITMKIDEKGILMSNYNNYSNLGDRSNTTNIPSRFSKEMPSKKVRTEALISVDKLTKHEIEFDVEISFSLRDFLAILNLAEQLSAEVCLYYDLAGRPLILTVEAHSSFDIELLLATTTNDEDFEVDGGLFQEIDLENENGEISRIAPKKKQKRGPEKPRKKPEPEIPEEPEILAETPEIPAESMQIDDEAQVPIQTSSVEEDRTADLSTHRTPNYVNRIPSTQSTVPLDQSWRQNEVQEDAPVEAQEIQVEPEIMEVHEIIEEVQENQDFFDLNFQPPSGSYDMFSLRKNLEEKEAEPEHEEEEEIEEHAAKRRKTGEFELEEKELEVEVEKKKRKLRRILMGSKSRRIPTNSQRQKSAFGEKPILVEETQRI
ncbi:unnamed protein product [Caenorhabditis angaria]|uniref:Cell cycle checkpoint control protein n=1 Tax=Caenorhabditis angaria TaxID=860376 RepID=A0A9P1IGC0_9PELO|nr:unnamed protein product [Caenorhabditis angaria]